MLRIIKDKIFYKNLLFALISLMLLFFCWLKWLDIYTNHNNYIVLPSFNDVHLNDLDSVISSYDLKYEIIDSVFDKSKFKGVVVNQDPLPNTNVKKNRRVYLTVNSINSLKVNFPDIFDLTLRQAVSRLKKNGLEIGNLEYQADIATNKILDFKVNGIHISVGQELYHGTIIDLVVGQGLSTEKVTIPNLIGLSREEANTILKSSSLNIGLEYFNHDILDSTMAVIYKQYPESAKNKKINIGSSIDLYFELLKKNTL
tara:strand:- start:541 stop:1311 length:771 start_codon:yes stop_codon:yes gene_type:complete